VSLDRGAFLRPVPSVSPKPSMRCRRLECHFQASREAEMTATRTTTTANAIWPFLDKAKGKPLRESSLSTCHGNEARTR